MIQVQTAKTDILHDFFSKCHNNILLNFQYFIYKEIFIYPSQLATPVTNSIAKPHYPINFLSDNLLGLQLYRGLSARRS